MTYPIVEIFDSIQGEGTYMGTPCTFIRFGQCNLNCSWCDTDWSKFKELTVDQVIEQIHHQLIVFTGGEPTIHNLFTLIETIREKLPDCFIHLETNGTNATEGYHFNWVTCSPKKGSNFFVHPRCNFNELKFVVDEDLTLENIDPYIHSSTIWLQPEASNMQAMWLKALSMAQAEPRLRVGVQLHKIMGVL